MKNEKDDIIFELKNENENNKLIISKITKELEEFK